jgi:hypothetical protein
MDLRQLGGGVAISQFVEPDINLFFDDLTQAARLDNKASFVGKGYINIELSNINNDKAPVLLRGSVFECGGVLFKSDSDSGVTGAPSGGQSFVCFNPSDKALFYSADAPAWNAVKGGWHVGNNRALAKVFYADGRYNGKVILDGFNAMRMANQGQPIPDSGGLQAAAVSNVKGRFSVYLPPGAYRHSLSSGAGAGDASGQTGGAASTREVKTGAFYWPGG